MADQSTRTEAGSIADEGVERRVTESAEAARRSAGELPDQARMRAGSGLNRAAGVLDRAGDWVAARDGDLADRAGSAAHDLADSLERAATYLRSRDLRGVRADLERQIDVHPIRSALIALGAGFLVGKILR